MNCFKFFSVFPNQVVNLYNFGDGYKENNKKKIEINGEGLLNDDYDFIIPKKEIIKIK